MSELPDGKPDGPDLGGTDMGALWRCDEPGGEGLVRFNNHEDYDDYEVEVYRLTDDGRVESTYQYWSEEEIAAFTSNPETAWLSGHNLAGVGAYGVFTAKSPNCPECGAFMSPGEPLYHGQTIEPVGYTCAKYDRTNGAHEGYMTQEEAIERGYYITIEQYLKRRYGGGEP